MVTRVMTGLSACAVVLAAAPWWMPPWMLFIASGALAKGLVVLGLVLLLRGGLLSFGHALYFCFGAYAVGFLVRVAGVREFSLLLPGALAATVALALLLGLFVCRYRGIFFGLLSLALSMVFYGLLIKVQALGSSDGFNVTGIQLLGLPLQGDAGRAPLYLVTLATAVLSALSIATYLRSRMGLLTTAVRDNELRVEYLGQSVHRLVLQNYLISAALAGAAGALSAVLVGHIGPEMAYWTTSGEFIFMAILGGTASVLAPFVGAAVFSALYSLAYGSAPHSWQLIVGGCLLACIVFLPEGLWSLSRRRARVPT
jgi:ABC-type branched-subunit amino acid transport system permease subunit